MKYLGLIWSNMWRKRIRTTLTILSVLVAFLLFGLLTGFKNAFQVGDSLETAERLITVHKVSLINMLPVSYTERIKRIPGIAEATHATWFGGYYQEPRNQFGQFPVDAPRYLAMYPELNVPEQQLARFMANQTGALVGRAIADQFNITVGDRLPLFSTLWPKQDGERNWEFQVEGILDDDSPNPITNFLLFHYEYFDEARGMGRGTVGWFIEKGDGSRSNTDLAADIDLEFANSPAETKTTNEAAFAEEYAKQFGDIGLIVTAILGAVFFTILLVSGNSMSQSVRERIPELAVLKTLGFSSASVLAMVLAEGVLIALIGGLIGLGLSLFALGQASKALAALLPLGMGLSPGALILAVTYMILLGLISGALPAVQAMRLTIIEALGRR
jgi:putative ABC transport system permease protein